MVQNILRLSRLSFSSAAPDAQISARFMTNKRPQPGDLAGNSIYVWNERRLLACRNIVRETRKPAVDDN